MKYKCYIVSFIFLLFFERSFSQEGTLEKSIIECRYKLVMQTDSIHKLNSITDEMILRIGETKSQFFSRHTFYHDSLWTEGQELAEKLTLDAFRTRNYSKMPSAKTTKDYIYKNYPEGKITVQTNDFKVGFIYEENYEPQDWIIEDSIKLYLGYNCQKANCVFRGRDWSVWFAPAIPIKDGPWKFNGLPGLVLEAYDSNNDYHYAAIRIDKKDVEPIFFYHFDKDPYLKTERKTYLNALKDFLTGTPAEDIGLIQEAIKKGKKQKYMSRVKKRLLYDFLERDYLTSHP